MDRRERGLDLNMEGLGLKRAGTFLGIVLAVVLAVVVGKQMSAEAMAVVVGVVCGVVASVPASLLLLFALSRGERQAPANDKQRSAAGAYPPVVVIQGGGMPQALPPGMSGYWPQAGPPAQRQFQVLDARDEQQGWENWG